MFFSEVTAVEVEDKEVGGPPFKTRKTDPSYGARQLVLDLCRRSDDVRTFYDFYNVVDEDKGHCKSPIMKKSNSKLTLPIFPPSTYFMRVLALSKLEWQALHERANSAVKVYYRGKKEDENSCHLHPLDHLSQCSW